MLLHRTPGGVFAAPRRTLAALLMVVAPWFAWAQDSATLDGISYLQLPGNRVQVELTLSRAVENPLSFAIDNPARVAHRAALDGIIEDCFGQRDRAAVVGLLREAGIAFGAVNSVADLAAHPQLRRLPMETPGGPLSMVAPPARLAGEEGALGAVPALDAHGPALRKEFGE